MIKRALGALGLAVLAGCSNSTSSSYELLGPVLATVTGAFGGAAPAAGGFEATDEQMRAFPDPLMVVETEATGRRTGFLLQGTNRDTQTWASQDGVTLSFRQGQLVSSRGLGNDLMSVDSPDIRPGRGTVSRVRYRLGGDERVVRRRFDCTLSQSGGETLSIAGLPRSLRRVTESCVPSGAAAADGQAFENRYWITQGGAVIRSRQFLTRELGYLTITRING
ncbi:YjbF family lipoprotein [Profundibacterium mesophilum]|uniref:YjbF family lipoprotein n=1 Tax=Profundibacterium mesophilum KAUST100406-0324 TaxID=1037889 RepID=A0A921NWI7_9RHOB|nr:YjbF family lipoprotein [Profundibacterium mesophilum]KAF0676968.1 hypothetical protein PMES_00765 [Profundibacterium mesophilum KAUST100406-0324]